MVGSTRSILIQISLILRLVPGEARPALCPLSLPSCRYRLVQWLVPPSRDVQCMACTLSRANLQTHTQWARKPVSRGSFFQTKPIIQVEERPPSAPVVAFIRVQNSTPPAELVPTLSFLLGGLSFLFGWAGGTGWGGRGG